MIRLSVVEILVALSAGERTKRVGLVMSGGGHPSPIIISLLAARFVAGAKFVIVLLAASVMMPLIVLTVRPPVLSPVCTV
jgi:hypothetical protein